MMTRKKHSQFVVRELRSEQELMACLDLDHTYSTDYVWQVDMRDAQDDVTVRFRQVRLPRTMQVAYPRDAQALLASWKHRDCFLIAIVENVVLGYVHMCTDAQNSSGWIHDLVVGEPFRNRRIGSALLEQATRWATLRSIKHITLEMQTKNYPAINFARRHGLSFCGFNDRYYTNQDIALFFGKNL
jgi:ribosomal protein S18 acetylase RimI-like enzyme